MQSPLFHGSRRFSAGTRQPSEDSSGSFLQRERSEEELRVLREFYRHPGWELFLRGLSERYETRHRELLAARSSEELIRLQGRLLGLEEAVTLRDTLVGNKGRQ